MQERSGGPDIHEGRGSVVARRTRPVNVMGSSQRIVEWDRISLRIMIDQLDTRPAVMGHSTGGLLTYMIADRGLSAASVAIDGKFNKWDATITTSQSPACRAMVT